MALGSESMSAGHILATRGASLPWRGATIIIPALIGILALWLRLHGLGDKPFWLDEMLTVERASRPVEQLVQDSLVSRHYPSYFLLVHGVTALGTDEWMVRLPSALFGALGVAVAARIAAEISGHRAALITGILMALSPFEVQFSQEARSHMLVSCLILVALWGMVRIAGKPATEAQPRRRWILTAPWAAYVFGTSAALNVLSVAIPWLLVSNLIMGKILSRNRQDRKALLGRWATAQTVVLVIWLPMAILLYLASRGTIVQGFAWIPKITTHDLWSIAAAVYLFRISDMVTLDLLPTLLPGFGIVVATAAAWGAWRLRRNRTMLAVVGLAAIAMPVTLLLVSLFHPMLVPRYLTWSTGPYYVLAGIGMAALRPAALFAIASVALVAGGAACLAPYYDLDTKPRWDLAVAYLTQHVEPGDAVITSAPYATYMVSSYGERFHFDEKALVPRLDFSGATDRLANGKRVWLVHGRASQGQITSREVFFGRYADLGPPAMQLTFGEHIIVLRYDPTLAIEMP